VPSVVSGKYLVFSVSGLSRKKIPSPPVVQRLVQFSDKEQTIVRLYPGGRIEVSHSISAPTGR
jgi:hypothetical protein